MIVHMYSIAISAFTDNLYTFVFLSQVDEDGFHLYETRAIARYLVAKYGPQSGLIPTELKKLGIFEQAASVEFSNFTPHASVLAVERVLKP